VKDARRSGQRPTVSPVVARLGNGAPGIVGAVAENVDDAPLDLPFDLANCTTAKSMPELIEVRPMTERGAARIDVATTPASSSSRIAVQSTTTRCSSSPDHSIKQMPIDPPGLP
jgi:hypothetical protein